MKSHMTFTQDCVREGVAVMALPVPEEDLPQIIGELGDKELTITGPCHIVVINLLTTYRGCSVRHASPLGGELDQPEASTAQ